MSLIVSWIDFSKIDHLSFKEDFSKILIVRFEKGAYFSIYHFYEPITEEKLRSILNLISNVLREEE